MFGSDILDIAIGVALTFLSVSLICSTIREGIESIMKTRAMDLERALREMLEDPKGVAGIVQNFFDHPIIAGLFGGKGYDPKGLVSTRGIGGIGRGLKMALGLRRQLPSYIPSGHFANAIVDLVMRGPAGGAPTTPTSTPLTIANLRSAADSFGDATVKRVVLYAIDTAKDDLDRVKTQLEDWFNGTMDRASGWYKRRTQFVLFIIGLFVAVFLNIDAITIVKRLASDATLRAATVVVAERMVANGPPAEATPPAVATETEPKTSDGSSDAGAGAETTATGTTLPKAKADVAPPTVTASKATSPASAGTPATKTNPTIAEVRKQLGELGIPMGWRGWWPAPQFQCDDSGHCPVPWSTSYGLEIIVGWLITAFATMLGAPFWFDVLSKFMTVRSTLKPKEIGGSTGNAGSGGGPGGGVGGGSGNEGSRVAAERSSRGTRRPQKRSG